jgi:hypothetical protein
MKLFKQTQPKTNPTPAVRVLSSAELVAVSGGLNPQPLPPRVIRT